MNRKDFIDEIFTFFKSKDEELKKAYDLAFTVKENIDWDKLYRIVLKEAETRYLPAPKWFLERFYRCNKVGNYNFANNQNVKVIVTLLDGYFYEFSMAGCNKSQKEITEGFYKYFKGKVKSVEFIEVDE